MANLYLTEQNSILRKSGDRLIVQKGDETLLEVQCHKIDAVLIFGNVQFTTQAVHELFQHGIEMAILTRSGKLIGQITSPTTKNITLRIQQFKKYEDNDFRLALARAIVAGKLKNSIAVIRLFSYHHPDFDFETEITSLQTRLKDVEAITLHKDVEAITLHKDVEAITLHKDAEAITLHKDVEAITLHKDVEAITLIEQLLGIEGSAARAYFAAFARMILNDSFSFPGRKKHPSTDPVNALLSLSYTMIFNEISSLLDGLGFDPYLAYYHSIEYGRASLAADLMEEFRAPIADRLVLNLINNRTLGQDDFYSNPTDSGVYLKREPLKRYFVEYESMLNHEFIHPETKEKTSFRKCFRLQAEKVASTIQNDNPYLPFTLEV